MGPVSDAWCKVWRWTLHSPPRLFCRLMKPATADEREATRVELVALACEVVVLTSLMEKDLAQVAWRSGTAEIAFSFSEHRNAALELLSPGFGGDIDIQALLPLVLGMRTRLRDLHHLRGRLDRMKLSEDLP